MHWMECSQQQLLKCYQCMPSNLCTASTAFVNALPMFSRGRLILLIRTMLYKSLCVKLSKLFLEERKYRSHKENHLLLVKIALHHAKHTVMNIYLVCSRNSNWTDPSLSGGWEGDILLEFSLLQEEEADIFMFYPFLCTWLPKYTRNDKAVLSNEWLVVAMR